MYGQFPPSLMAGLIVAGNICLWLSKNYGWEHFMIEYYENPTRHIRERVNNAYDIGLDAAIFTNIPIHEISYSYTIAEINPSKYAIWIFNGYFGKNGKRNSLYDLYEFDKKDDILEFIRGISTICCAFNLDISQIILAYPLHNKSSYFITEILLPVLS
jgi:hypothetical protein